mgnify:CR=1 FL=1
MKNWNDLFGNLPDEEKDKIALLRVIECSNGVVQHMFRANDEDALSIEETRDAMKFSMGCMKTMSIPLKSKTVTFNEDAAVLFKEMRRLYVSGFKKNNPDDLNEFFVASKANLHAIGPKRILNAKDIALKEVSAIPANAIDWGIGYIFNFAGWS